MASQDLKNQLTEGVALNVQAISSDTTTAGAIIDTEGYESVTFIMQAGAVSAGDVTMLIQDGDDSGLSDAANVVDAYLLGTEAATTLDTANTTSMIGYVGHKRYVRLSAVTANSANLTVGACYALSHARENAAA